MKRYVILAIVAAVALVLFLVWSRKDKDASGPENSKAPQQAVGVGNSNDQSDRAATEAEPRPMVTAPGAIATNQDDKFLQLVRERDEAANVAVSFFGMVVDQDSNALKNVAVDLEVVEEYSEPLPDGRRKRIPFQKETGADGRFEVSGLKGRYIGVYTFTKAGYEQEFPGRAARYGVQSGSFTEPIVFRMWSTNLHEPLISGEKSFVVVPDGRRYGIDLVKGTIAEGEQGDFVAWIKRPEGVKWGQRYDWSYELTVPEGGLLETESQAMFTAPEVGYTNAFSHQEQAGVNGWSVGFAGKRFYVKLRNGQIYGRVIVDVFADFHGKQPAMIRLSYAVNPSGSRLLR